MHRVHLRDIGEMAPWFAGHGHAIPTVEDFPHYGMIEPGVAAGFLLLTNSNTAFLEYFVTNPRAGLRARWKAVNAIAKSLLEEAHAMGYRRVIVMSKKKGILDCAVNLGFKTVGSYVIMSTEI